MGAHLDTAAGAVLDALLDGAGCRPGSACSTRSPWSTDDERGSERRRGPAARRRPNATRCSRAFEGSWRPSRRQARGPGLISTCKDVVGQVRVRDRQRRAARLQRADRGIHPGAGQRRGAHDEAGQRRRPQPGRRRRARSSLIRTRRSSDRVTQRALQAHADPCSAARASTAVGYVVSELSPYEVGPRLGRAQRARRDRPCSGDLGRATAKVHCVSDEDSDADLVDFQTEDEIDRRSCATSEFAEEWPSSASATREIVETTTGCSSMPFATAGYPASNSQGGGDRSAAHADSGATPPRTTQPPRPA